MYEFCGIKKNEQNEKYEKVDGIPMSRIRQGIWRGVVFVLISCRQHGLLMEFHLAYFEHIPPLYYIYVQLYGIVVLPKSYTL